MTVFAYAIPHLLALMLIIALSHEETLIIDVLPILWPILLVLDLFEKDRADCSTIGAPIIWRLLLWAWTPFHVALVLVCLYHVADNSLAVKDVIITGGFVGFFLGMIGIPIAHELMHHKYRFERYLSEILMILFSYPHFCIEHIGGHHRNLCTAIDPISTNTKKSFYKYYPIAVAGSLIDAWEIESERLKRHRYRILSLKNRMLRYYVVLLLLYILIYIAFGVCGVAFFLLQGIIGFSLLELINYIQHYGLSRSRDRSGSYEKVNSSHSWDSNHIATNYMLFNLGYHADHHCNPNLSFEKLKHTKSAPQLPVGYFIAIWICLIPPLWCYLMERQRNAS